MDIRIVLHKVSTTLKCYQFKFGDECHINNPNVTLRSHILNVKVMGVKIILNTVGSTQRRSRFDAYRRQMSYTQTLGHGQVKGKEGTVMAIHMIMGKVCYTYRSSGLEFG